MIQELCFVNAYLETGAGSPAYGARYLNELLNFIPRVDLAFKAIAWN